MFSGHCGREFAFEVEMKGEKDGARVRFEGDVDLGEKDGGLYHWTGVIGEEQFLGQYLYARGKKGDFSMKLERR